MLLKNKFFKVDSSELSDATHAVYHVTLLADCDCYRGHFPGKPVSPGVCNIEMIKECAELLTGKDLLLTAIKQCRLTAVASPAVCPQVDVTISAEEAENGYTVTGLIADSKTSYMEFKGTLSIPLSSI